MISCKSIEEYINTAGDLFYNKDLNNNIFILYNA